MISQMVMCFFQYVWDLDKTDPVLKSQAAAFWIA